MQEAFFRQRVRFSRRLPRVRLRVPRHLQAHHMALLRATGSRHSRWVLSRHSSFRDSEYPAQRRIRRKRSRRTVTAALFLKAVQKKLYRSPQWDNHFRRSQLSRSFSRLLRRQPHSRRLLLSRRTLCSLHNFHRRLRHFLRRPAVRTRLFSSLPSFRFSPPNSLHKCRIVSRCR